VKTQQIIKDAQRDQS